MQTLRRYPFIRRALWCGFLPILVGWITAVWYAANLNRAAEGIWFINSLCSVFAITLGLLYLFAHLAHERHSQPKEQQGVRLWWIVAVALLTLQKPALWAGEEYLTRATTITIPVWIANDTQGPIHDFQLRTGGSTWEWESITTGASVEGEIDYRLQEPIWISYRQDRVPRGPLDSGYGPHKASSGWRLRIVVDLESARCHWEPLDPENQGASMPGPGPP